MATEADLARALSAADAAGDTQGAADLAKLIINMRSQTTAQAPAQPAVIDMGDAASNAGAGILEPALSMASGGLAAPIAGVAGLAGGAVGYLANKLGLTNKSGTDVAGDTVRGVQDALTYKPQTARGQSVAKAISLPFAAYAAGANDAGGRVTDLTGSPALGAGVNALIQGAPMALGLGKAPAVAADPAALARLADFKAANMLPLLGQVTNKAAQFSKEQNLARLTAGAPIADRLATQNTQLINQLNTAGAAAAPTDFATGQTLIGNLSARGAAEQAKVKSLYAQADATMPGGLKFDGVQFADDANAAIKNSGRQDFLPGPISKIINRVNDPNTPFTLNDVENVRSILAEESRKATSGVAPDGNTAYVVGKVRQALENTEPITPEAGQASDLYSAARNAHRQFMQRQDQVPAYADAIREAAPDNFFQTHVLNADVRDVQGMLAVSPESIVPVKQQVLAYLKNKALSGATDEKGVFSQSNYNKALSSIGDDKLNSIFSPDEVGSLQRIGRVSEDIQKAPVADGVNRSNTAATLLNKGVNLAANIPVAKWLGEPLNKYLNYRDVKNALNGAAYGQPAKSAVDLYRTGAQLYPFLNDMDPADAKKLLQP